jgi:putative membrane protein
MSLVATGAVLLVAVLHLGFMVLESVLWTQPTGRRIFGLSREDAEKTKVLAMNQGVYNGVLGGGLIWASLTGNGPTELFLLVFVVLVGLFGAATVKPTIFVFQALPALVAIGLRLFTA